ncbi:hypothetical protein J5N97_002449 [Dioscorea zingiberensis]|uniref:C2H2-type domain-containing protein n=1 Tax=Dioscorea zingiberensis TaxID=325984 RepID=A0A9D5HPG5_9LILI|nr:hypothetical protein J5N97_002449 [Dioscorea zingiberensis]
MAASSYPNRQIHVGSLSLFTTYPLSTPSFSPFHHHQWTSSPPLTPSPTLMAFIHSLSNGFRSLFLLFLLYLGCFFFSSSPNDPTPHSPRKRRKISPLASSPHTTTTTSSSSVKPHNFPSIRSYLAHLLSFRKPTVNGEEASESIPTPTPTCPTPPPSSPQPLALSPDKSPSLFVDKATPVKRPSFASRADIYPCLACGELLPEPRLLDIHHATKHSLSELSAADSGKNIIEMIFRSGWRGRSLTIHRILKIHNTAKTLARFEEYREIVRSRAARQRRDERCIADGNERLRFYCSTALCAMGREGRAAAVGVCGSQFCSACGIVRHGFSGKHAELEGIPTHATSWGAHGSLPEELEEEFAFLRVKRAMVVCRVVAGRVAHGGADEEEKGGCDSVVVVGRGSGARSSLGGDEELLVFNARALLACFVIIYTV